MRVSRRVVGAVLVVVGSAGLAATVIGSLTTVAAQEAPGANARRASAEGLRVFHEVRGFVLADRFVDSGAPVA